MTLEKSTTKEETTIKQEPTPAPAPAPEPTTTTTTTTETNPPAGEDEAE